MSITLIRRKEGNFPTIVCDVCGQAIEDASKGYVLWAFDYENPEGWRLGPVEQLTFIHQGRCDAGNRKFPMSMALDEYLYNLLWNSKYNAKEAKEHVDGIGAVFGVCTAKRKRARKKVLA